MDEAQLKLALEIYQCNRCPNLDHCRLFLQGNPQSKIWVIGLNPHTEDSIAKRPDKFEDYIVDMREYFAAGNVHSYFKDFRYVLGPNWKKEFHESVATLDLVKCASAGYNKFVKAAEQQCGGFLERQIEVFKPELIICNGAPVCNWFRRNCDIRDQGITATSVRPLGRHAFTVVFSGFIGRIDNYARLRLGREVAELRKRLRI